ncbi:hypothetical protein L9F63_011542, partial [Diploptera punctata]
LEYDKDMLVDEEDDREINVDTDSRCSGTVDEESCGSRTSSIIDGVDDVQIRSCSATGTLSSRQALPFSISRLLGSDFETNNNSVNGGRQVGTSLEKGTDNIATSMLFNSQDRGISQHEALTSLYTHPAIVQLSGLAAAGLVYSTAAGVIRVPAHRPPPPPTLGAPSGAAVVKERLTENKSW